MPRLGVIEINQLPAFAVLETISTETILAARMAQIVNFWSQNDPPNAAQYDVGSLEFDPIKVDQECSTYFELMLRDRVNQAARAVSLADASGTNIDHIASRYPGGMPRLAGESDIAYKTRVWLSPNTLTQNGTYESYIFFALTACQQAGIPLRDCQVLSTPGSPDIQIILMNDGPALSPGVDSAGDWNGTFTAFPDPAPTQAQLAAASDYILAPGMGRKGLTDVVTFAGPNVTNISIEIDVTLFPGWDQTLTMNALATAMATLVENQRYLGYSYMEASYDAALETSGVYDVTVVSPVPADTVISARNVIVPTSIILNYVGRGGIGPLPPTD